MRVCVSDGFTFEYFFNVLDTLTVDEFLPTLQSYLRFKSKNEDLSGTRLSTLPRIDLPNPWALGLEEIKTRAVDLRAQFRTLPKFRLNDGSETVHLLVSGFNRRQYFQEISEPKTLTPSASYDPCAPTKDEDYDLFRPAVLIFALAMQAANRERINVTSVLESELGLNRGISLDIAKSYGLPSALSVNNFLEFIENIFPGKGLFISLKKAWALNTQFITVEDLERILKIGNFPLMHASFQGAIRMAFMLTDIPFTKAFPISSSLKPKYVLAIVEPLLRIMLEVAIRSALNGGYPGVNAGFLPRQQSEERLREAGPGAFLLRISNCDLAISYVPVPKNIDDLPNPLKTVGFGELASVGEIAGGIGGAAATGGGGGAAAGQLKVVHEILKMSNSYTGFILRGVEYPHPTAALIAHGAFLQNPCIQAAGAILGFGYPIGAASQKRPSAPAFVLLNMAMHLGFANIEEPLDENLLKKMRAYVLRDLTNALGGNELLFDCFSPKLADEAPPPVHQVLFRYSRAISSSVKNTPRAYNFLGMHGTLSLENTSALLANRQPGSYLLRRSQSDKSSIVLAFVDAAGKMQQTLISPDTTTPQAIAQGKVTCSGHTFPSLQSVIISYSIAAKAGESALLRTAVSPYNQGEWKREGNLFALRKLALSASSRTSQYFPPAAPVASDADEPVVVSITSTEEPQETDPASPPTLVVKRTYERRDLVRWDSEQKFESRSLVETVWRSVVESGFPHQVLVPHRVKSAIVLPNDAALVISPEEIRAWLDNTEGLRQLRAFSFVLECLTHGNINKVTSNLAMLDRATKEKLITYSTKTNFIVIENVLKLIRENLSPVNPSVEQAATAPQATVVASTAPQAEGQAMPAQPVAALVPAAASPLPSSGRGPMFFGGCPATSGTTGLLEGAQSLATLQAAISSQRKLPTASEQDNWIATLTRLNDATKAAALANTTAAAINAAAANANAAAAAAKANVTSLIKEAITLFSRVLPEEATAVATPVVATPCSPDSPMLRRG